MNTPLPHWLLIPFAWYLTLSLITFIAFARDKRTAIQGHRRIPERTLHLLEVVGGFPGAFLAMLLLRHKNRKASYVLITLLIAAAHIAAWAFAAAR